MNQPANRFRAEFFKALGHPIRIVILEALRDQERSVTDLQIQLGMEQSNVSRQLAVLRARGIVEDRKEGTLVYYRVRDSMVWQLLETARMIFNNHLIDTQQMLQQLAEEQVDVVER